MKQISNKNIFVFYFVRYYLNHKKGLFMIDDMIYEAPYKLMDHSIQQELYANSEYLILVALYFNSYDVNNNSFIYMNALFVSLFNFFSLFKTIYLLNSLSKDGIYGIFYRLEWF